MKESNPLRDMAKRAKKRMIGGFWTENKDKFDEFIQNNANQAEAREIFAEYKRASILKQSQLKTREDERLYKLVKEIIEEDDGLNAIGRLIDRSKYDKMSIEEKQTYVLELSTKYLVVKERYLREKMLEEKLGLR